MDRKRKLGDDEGADEVNFYICALSWINFRNAGSIALNGHDSLVKNSLQEEVIGVIYS